MAVASVATEVRTFLIADVRGYTRFTLERGDEAAAHLASRFAEIAREVVASQGGEVIELRGDEALAVFASARAALRGAVDLQARFAHEAEADPELPLNVGVGLDAGEAIPVDGGYRGAALNLAARLCSLAGPGEVLASEAVVHLASRVEGLDYVDRDKVELKGFADPVPIVQIMEQADTMATSPLELETARARAVPIGGFLGALPSGALVARDSEMHRVLDLVDAVADGQGQLVMLAGEPGAGKTRLAQEVSLDVRNRGFFVATGRCYEPEGNVPFYPFVEALETLVEIAPAELRRDIPRQWPYLDRLLGDGEVSGHGGGQEEQQRLFRAVTGFVQALAKGRPVAILLDDLQWADGSSLKLLQHLARHTRADQVLLLGTYRDVDVGRQHPLERALLDLGRERLIQRVDVGRLDQEGTARVMAATMGESEISDEFAALVYRRTDGNPFFIEEVMRALVERGDVYREENRWGRREVDEIEVPESIRSVIGQRLSVLGEATQEMLREASILGQTFAFEDLQALSGRSEDEIDAGLEEAEGAGLVRPVRGDTYIFKHALTQQTLLAELSPRRRRRLHLAAGEALERLPEKEREQQAAELAWHFLNGDDPERALRWSMKAGDAAATIFAHTEAEAQYRTAVELARELGEGAQEANALERLGRTLHWQGRLDEAIATLEEAAGRYRELGDRVGEARTVAHSGRVHSDRGSNDEGIARLQPLLDELAARGSASQEVGELEVALAHLYWRSSRYQESAEHAGKGSEIARALGDDDLLLEAETRRGTALLNIEPEEARRVLEETVRLAEEQDNLQVLALALTNLSNAFGLTDRRRVLDYLRRALEVAQRVGYSGGIMFTMSNLASELINDGKLSEARAMLEHAKEIGTDLGSSYQGTYVDLVLAHVLIFQGEFEEAKRLDRRAAESVETSGDRQGTAILLTGLSIASTLEGHPEEDLDRLRHYLDEPFSDDPWALTVRSLAAWSTLEVGGDNAADRAAALIADMQRPIDVDRLFIDMCTARIRARQDRWNEAIEIVEGALAVARQVGLGLWEGLLLDTYGEVLALKGDVQEARKRWDEALAVLRRAEAHAWAWRVERRLASLPA